MPEELRDMEPLRRLLSHPPLAILSDIDGTLAPIVRDPEASRITDRARNALRELIGQGVRVGFVTGRALEKARAIVNMRGAYFGANHGLNIYADGIVETPESVRPYTGLVADVLRQIGGIGTRGIFVEDKGPIIAFHYRMAHDKPEAEAAIRAAIKRSPAASNFRIHQGRRVIELRPELPIDKGTAVADLAHRMGAGALLTMGDDATDLDMFRGADLLEQEGMPVLRIAVENSEAGPTLLDASDYCVRGVDGIEWMLEELVRVLRLRAPAGP